MQLVVLAAGRGQRFGGLKQLAAVGPSGEAIMDYTVRAALDCGFTGVVLVVSNESAGDIRTHVEHRWPTSLEVDYAFQPPRPGTAQAVLAARDLITGPFGVANADDLYAEKALTEIVTHFASLGAPTLASRSLPVSHVLVAYELVQTVLTSGPVTRGLIQVSDDGCLDAILEHRVQLREDGQFDASPLPGHGSRQIHGSLASATKLLTGKERVSMNLWGFDPSVFVVLGGSPREDDPGVDGPTELLIPDVVEQLISDGSGTVQVVDTDARCIGLTHREDLPILQEELTIAPLGARSIPSGPAALAQKECQPASVERAAPSGSRSPSD